MRNALNERIFKHMEGAAPATAPAEPGITQEGKKMTIAVIREYTEADKARVKAAAERFCQRHGITFDPDSACDAENAIDYWIFGSHPEDKAYRRKLWTACYCRALRVPYDVRTTTDYGHIGVTVE